MAKKKNKDSLLLNVKYLVEADMYASHALWEENQAEFDPLRAMSWEQVGPCTSIVVGEILREEIRLSFRYFYLDGHLVSFWYCDSMVRHIGMIRDWFDENVGCGRCDASNFEHCIRYIKDQGVAKRAPEWPTNRSFLVPDMIKKYGPKWYEGEMGGKMT